MATEQRTCFVIMPFSKTTEEHTEDYWTRHFTDILKPLIEEVDASLVARRSSPLRGEILRQIITDLVLSPIVVADLTDRNANVYWELGVRQSFRHGTIAIIDARDRIPFDLSTTGTLHYYPHDHIKMSEFSRKFKATINDCLARPNDPDSQVLQTIGGRGTLFELFRKDEAARRLEALISEIDMNLRSLDYYVHLVERHRAESSLAPLPPRPLRTASIELLMTNRYLDEDDAFYREGNYYYTFLEELNDRLQIGRIFVPPDSGDVQAIVGGWVVEEIPRVKKLIEKFRDRLSITREKLKHKF